MLVEREKNSLITPCESMRHMNPVAEEAMSVANSSDDSAVATAVFRHLQVYDNFALNKHSFPHLLFLLKICLINHFTYVKMIDFARIQA